MDTNDSQYTRRGLLRVGAGVVTAGAVAAASTGAVSAQAYDGYLDETDNFNNETADAREFDPVPIDVGYGDGLQFGPYPAVLVEPGATIRWTWTGAGGNHNVVHDVDEEERVFDSRSIGEGTHAENAIGEEGFTYEMTLEEEGIYPYVCTPHRTVDMKGVIVVGEDNAETDLVIPDFDVVDVGLGPIWGGAAAFGLVSFLGLAAYHELAESESESH